MDGMNEAIGFLTSDVSRLLRRRFDERARLIGVTRTQWRAIKYLERHEGINQGGLADMLEVEPITLCRMIDRLAEAGLVERRRDPADRRAWRIFLTERTRPLLDDLHAIAGDLFATALDGIAPAEHDATIATLQRIHANLSHTNSDDEAANG